MQMKIVRVSADGKSVTLMGTVDDIRSLRDMVGVQVDVSIGPHLRFAIGDRVHYSSVIGEPPTEMNRVIKDGPFLLCGTLCWKLDGKSGCVADEALTPAAA